MKKIATLLCALAALSACSTKQNNAETEGSTKSLILYYSQTHATEQVAKAIQAETGADMEAIEAVKPYDGDFQQTIARC